MTREETWLRGGLVAIVIAHFGVALWYSAARVHVTAPLTFLQRGFLATFILALPLVGAVLLWTRRKHGAASLITACMAGSLVFGFVNHFMLDSRDYVMAVRAHAWRSAFIFSGTLLVLTEAIGAIMGAVAARTWRRP